jgi:hypothetical protein
MLTTREQRWVWAPHRWVWPEYGAYVGWIVLALAATGIVIALASRGRRHLVAGSALFFAFTMGAAGRFYPWPLMQLLPVYKSIHLPSRWRVMLLFYLALLAGLALTRATAAARRYATPRVARILRAGLALIVVAAAIDMLSVSLITVNKWTMPPLEDEHLESPYHLIPGFDFWEKSASDPRRNVGTTQCYDAVPWPQSRSLWFGEGLQARVVRGDGTVRATGRTNLTAWADVTLRQPSRIVFNENFADGFRASVGTVVSDDGRVAVDAPAGTRRIVVRFTPPDLPWTVPISATGLAVCVAVPVVLRRRRRRRASGGKPNLLR